MARGVDAGIRKLPIAGAGRVSSLWDADGEGPFRETSSRIPGLAEDTASGVV